MIAPRRIPQDEPLDGGTCTTETARELVSLAGARTGRLSAEYLARHVLDVTDGGDWPVRRAAMEALLRRIAACEQDALHVASRPARGAVFGAYATRRPRAEERPYATWLGGVLRLRASCDCRDFLRNSLGLCKHVIAILRDLTARRRFERACTAPSVPFADRRHLRWEPVRPLSGHGDWLDRLALVAPRNVTWPGRGIEDPARRAACVRKLAADVAADRVAAEPAVVALLRDETARPAAAKRGTVESAELRKALASLRQPLYPYQQTGVARFLAAGAMLLADDMGLGKTAQAIASCHALWSSGRVRRGLLIVPSSLKPQWQREWRQFTDVPLTVVEGGPAEREAAYRETREGFLVANYEQVLRDLETMHAWKPDLVVLDEAQRIKNWATKTAAYVKRLRPRWRLVLTGTPMENRLDELASLMDWVDDHALEPKWRLAPWHTVHTEGTGSTGGARHLDTLRERLAPSMLRRVRHEVLTQLPSRTDTVVPVELSAEQREEHDALQLPISQLLAIAKRRPLTQAQFLRLMSLFTTQRIISNGMAQLRFQEVWGSMCASRCPDPALLDALGSPKLRELREIVSQVAVAQGRRIVVFSQWRRMLRLAEWAVSDLLVTQGLRAAFFTGAESTKRRTQNIVDFHDDPAVRVLFLTDAGGVGLNLQRAASCCVNIELPWNPAVLEQRVGRIHRLGQRDPIDVYNLVAQNCIESRIAGLVEDKRALFTGLFDGASDEIRFDRATSFLSRLERLVEPVVVPELAAVDGAGAADTPESDGNDEAVSADGAASREIDALVAAADESGDAPPAADDETAPPTGDRLPHDAATARPASPRGADVVRQLFAGLSVRSTADGGLRIDAPPEDAANLAAVLEGLAGLLRAAATTGAGARPV